MPDDCRNAVKCLSQTHRCFSMIAPLKPVNDASLNEWTYLQDLSIIPMLRHLVAVGSLPLIVSLVGLVASFGSLGGRIFFAKAIVIVVWGMLGSFFLHEYCHFLVARKFNPTILAKWEVGILRISLLEKGSRSPYERVVIDAAGPVITFVVGLGLLLLCHFICLFSVLSVAVEDVVVIVSIGHVLHILYLLPFFSDGRTILCYIVARF